MNSRHTHRSSSGRHHPTLDQPGGLRQVLRTLDPADQVLTSHQQQRAANLLEQILTTPLPPAAGSAPRLDGPLTPAGDRCFRSSRRPVRRLVLVGAATVVAAVSFLAVDFGGSTAYASWTPTATTLTPQELDTITPACVEALQGRLLDMDRAELALSERRGDYAVVLYRTDDPDLSGTCLVDNPAGTSDIDVLGTSMGGGSGPAPRAPAGGFTQGAATEYAGASITDGAVGPDVVGVTIHAENKDIHATIANGRWAAWWPGRAFSHPTAGAAQLAITFNLTLADGTVMYNAQPAAP